MKTLFILSTPLCSILLLGCSSGTSAGDGAGTSASDVVETVDYQAASGRTTPIFVHVEPGAACAAHPAGAASEPGAEAFYADERGWLRLGVTMPPGAPEVDLGFACTAPGGGVVDRVLAIHAIAGSAAPAGNPAPPPAPGRTRPALEGDPTAVTQRELTSRGYPPRPDPAAAPEAYAAWLAVVSRPSFVPEGDALLVPKGSQSRGSTSSSSNWSGAYTTEGPHAQVSASWTVPWISTDPMNLYTRYESCAWQGLGGAAHSSGLIQAGTWHTLTLTTDVVNGVPTAVWLANYSAWYESTSDTGNGAAHFLSSASYPVDPGDAVYSATYICDADGALDASGEYGCMSVSDSTWGWTSPIEILPIDGPASWVDAEADYIVERPSVGGSTSYGLASYGTVTFTGLSPALGSGANLVTMIRSSDTLSSPTLESSTKLLLTWEACE
jgi:hypothetical protein